MDVATEKSDR